MQGGAGEGVTDGLSSGGDTRGRGALHGAGHNAARSIPNIRNHRVVRQGAGWAAAGISDSGISGFFYAARAGC